MTKNPSMVDFGEFKTSCACKKCGNLNFPENIKLLKIKKPFITYRCEYYCDNCQKRFTKKYKINLNNTEK